MRWKSAPDRYGAVAIAIHWVSAALILVLFVSGLRGANAVDAAAKMMALRVHVVLGIAVLVLTLARAAWWLFADTKPRSVAGMSSLQERMAKAVHVLFYVVILGMIASGIGMLVLSGAGSILLGGAHGVLPEFWNYPPRVPHRVGAVVLVALFALHLGGALYHHFVRRDGLLNRMRIGSRPVSGRAVQAK
jgi:cytochrome b561